MRRSYPVLAGLLLPALACTDAPAPLAPPVPRAQIVPQAGNPPPPPVRGVLQGAFSPITAIPLRPLSGVRMFGAPAPQQVTSFNFGISALYNKAPDGTAYVEQITGDCFVSSRNNVTSADGIAVVIDPATNNRWTVNFSQLDGIVGNIFGACTVQTPDPTRCIQITRSMVGTVEFWNGHSYSLPVAGRGQLSLAW